MRQKLKHLLPENVIKLVGTKVKVSGYIFNRTTEIKEYQEFDCLDVRKGSGFIVDTKTMEEKGGTFQCLLKRDGMKKSQWTLQMPIN